MSFSPSFDAFVGLYDAGCAQVVSTTLVADLETPVSAMLKLGEGEANAFLLDSVEGGAVRGRYSIIGLKPDLIWRCIGDKASLNRRARADTEAFVEEKDPPLVSLRKVLAESEIDLPEGYPPMAAGMVGYFGYDMVRLMERLPNAKPAPIAGIPDGLLVRPTIMAIFDTVKDEILVVTPVRPEAGVSAKVAYTRACERLSDVIDALDRPLGYSHEAMADLDALPEPVSNTEHDDYLKMVERARDYIGAGDIFQVVLSQRFEVPFALPPFAYYRALRRINPSPYMYYLAFGDFAIVGSSPEILVRLRDGKVTIRPLAGTRPRGATPEEDRTISAGLLADPKELAEHLMLLDLGRNDVGRVAKVGTVKVTDKNSIEYYSHVMHIVSNVEGEIDPKYDGIDALIGGFPAGTVSGAPKVRAMQIIDELEKDKRGVYAGAVGYFSANGNMDSAIALRTAILKDGTLYAQAGAGIVADSVPENEYQECRQKARALFRAAEEAVRYASMPGRGQ
jgi:anthranilate synthase component 1